MFSPGLRHVRVGAMPDNMFLIFIVMEAEWALTVSVDGGRFELVAACIMPIVQDALYLASPGSCRNLSKQLVGDNEGGPYPLWASTRCCRGLEEFVAVSSL